MSLINVSNLTFAYDGNYDNVFTNATFQIDTDWKLGFCGRNGRGKTTFLKLLMGQYEYTGRISAGVSFDYFPYDIPDKSPDTLSVLSSITSAQLWEIEKELSALNISDDVLLRPFESLSNGEQTKVLIVGLFLRAGGYLLIDEPTNHLDMASREVLARYLNRKSGFILVSHDRALLDKCTDHTLSINKNGIEVVAGSFSIWWEQKHRQDAFELAQNERLEREIGRLKASVAQTANWSECVEKTKYATQNSGLRPDRGFVGHKAAKMMKRSKSTEKRRQSAIDEKSELLKNVETTERLKLAPLEYHSERLLLLDKVTLFYGERSVCSNVNFELRSGDRIALSGANGSGKSSLLKLICGQAVAFTGNIYIGSRLEISYVPQDASFLAGSLDEFARLKNIDKTLLMAILRKLDFSREQFDKDMQSYSAGQKKKVLIAGSLCQRAHLYVWDEPLNYIDVYSRMQIEQLILAHKPTLIFVEHDRVFCDNIATGVVQLG